MRGSRCVVFSPLTGVERLSIQMALRDIFKFRELPESETSKPFLEHLEDLRWTIVKMAITLVVAMIICFAFRSALVRVMQAPLRDVGPQIGALKALGITDSIVISFHLAFYAGIVISFPLRVRLLFLVVAQDDSLLLPRHRVARLDTDVDGAAVLFFCDAVHDRFRSRFRTAGGSARPRALRIDHLQIHGAHPPLRDRAHFYPGHDHHTDA